MSRQNPFNCEMSINRLASEKEPHNGEGPLVADCLEGSLLKLERLKPQRHQ